MKRTGFLIMVLILAATQMRADVIPVQVVPNQSILVWIAGKDPKSVEELELDILSELAKHEVQGQRFSTLFPQGLPTSADQAIEKMRASGCASLLVMRRRSAINWDTPSKEKNLSSLRLFLVHRSQVLNPKNQVESDSAPITVPNLYSNTEMEIVKGEGLLFDISKEKLSWRGDTQIKSAKDLPMSRYYRLVAEKVVSRLADAHLIPPGKK